MTSLRFGIVGAGNIAGQHAATLLGNEVEGATLTAIASRSDPTPPIADYPIHHFNDARAMMDSGAVDAVLIATPTLNHLEVGLAACERSLPLVMEKPLGRSIGEGQSLVDAVRPGQTAAVMLNQRFDPAYSTIRRLISEGALGRINRVSWIMTNWYRPDVYFLVSDWRGTWAGEGGGLLMNQCIHNLDILQWLVGMPMAVSAQAGFGRYHPIDVEDEVTAWLRFEDGATGMFVASTGEVPGSNQLEIVGDRATLRFNGESVEIHHVEGGVAAHSGATREMFGSPEVTVERLEAGAAINQHAAVLSNFVAAHHGHATLETPLAAGLDSLTLANAMLLSAWQNSTVSLPLDAERYESLLAERSAPGLREAQSLDVEVDMSKSYR